MNSNTRNIFHRILSYFIASVWLINGLYCKVFGLVPRHELIVSRILGEEYGSTFVILIGLSEIIMALWILSRFKARLNAFTQIFIILLMNILEVILVPDLLLWGKLNILFAFLFTLVIYFNEIKMNKTS